MFTVSLQEIAPALQGQPVFCDMIGVKRLRQAPDTVVFAAGWQGTPVVVKHWFGDDAVAAATCVAEELRRLAGVLTGPSFRVVDVVHHDVARAALVMRRAPGHPLSELLLRARPEHRRDLTKDALRWVQASAVSTRQTGRFAPLFWVRRLAQQELRGLSVADRALVQRVLEALRDQAPALRGTPVDQAQAHSDFSVFNLHKAGDVLTAFDLHSAAPAPIARTVARFLVSLRVDRCRYPGPLHWGADAAMLTGVGDARVLHGDHSKAQLAFFMGEYLVDRFVARYADLTGQAARRARLDNYLETAKIAYAAWG